MNLSKQFNLDGRRVTARLIETHLFQMIELSCDLNCTVDQFVIKMRLKHPVPEPTVFLANLTTEAVMMFLAPHQRRLNRVNSNRKVKNQNAFPQRILESQLLKLQRLCSNMERTSQRLQLAPFEVVVIWEILSDYFSRT
jgi:hypothetical protein